MESTTETRSSVPAPASRRLRPSIVLLLAVVAGLCALAFLRHDLTSGVGVKRVAILKPGFDYGIWCLGAGAAVLALALAAWCAWQRLVNWCYLCAFMAVIVFPAVAGSRLVGSLAPWIICSTLEGPDGEQYVFLDSSFLQGQTLALGRHTGDGWLYQHYDILGDTNGDSPRSYALLVRPTNKVRTTYGQLHLTAGGMVLGIRYDNHCYFAYDIHADAFIGRDVVEGLSPFLLLEADSTLYEKDIEGLVEHLRDRSNAMPLEEVRMRAAEHPNPEVRRLAELFVDE